MDLKMMPTKKKNSRSLALVGLAGLTGLTGLTGLSALQPAHAALPDAGQLLNEQQRAKLPADRTRADDQVLLSTPASATKAPTSGLADGGFRAQIQRVHFSGLRPGFSDAALQSWVAGQLERPLSHAELQALAARVTAGLQAQGYLLARAYLPRQDLSAGALEIAVQLGRLQDGPARIQVLTPDAALAERLRAIAEAALPDGDLRAEQLDRALLLINDVPGVLARGALEKGDQPGSSRLLIKVDELPAWGASALVDNFSNRYTGDWRSSLQLTLKRPLQREDLLGINLSHSSGTSQAAANYSLALNPNGLRANLAASALRYEIGAELAALELTGTARAFSAGLSTPLLRGREANLWASVDAEQKRLSDRALGASLRERRVHRLAVQLSGNRWDELLGGGQSELNLGLAVGQLKLADNAADAYADSLTAKTQGGFHKLTWRLARNQSLAGLPQWSVYAGAVGQQAARNLDSSEKFILGGPSGVRAYASGEAAGDSGWLANLELRRELSLGDAIPSLRGLRGQLLAFADHGQISLHSQPWQGSLGAAKPNSYALSGVGLGLNLQGRQWQLRSAWARGVGSNEGLSARGLDSEGQSKRQRFWLQAGAWY